MNFVQIPKSWAESMAGKQVENVIFFYFVDKDGLCWTLNELVKVFLIDFVFLASTQWELNVVQLDFATDFPQPLQIFYA